MNFFSLIGAISMTIGALFAVWFFVTAKNQEAKPKRVACYAVSALGVAIVVFGAVQVNVGSNMALSENQEMQAIRTEIAAMPLREQERTYFLKRLDPKPSGGIFGGYEEATIVDARSALQEARAAAQAKK